MRKTFGLAAALACGLGFAIWAPLSIGPASIAPAEASSAPPEFQELVGGRASAGEEAFRGRGYVLARLRGLTAWWWKGGEERCIRTVTERGMYSSVASLPNDACFQ